MSSEHSYARRGRHQPLHEQAPSGTPQSWSDHELWQRPGASRISARGPLVPRIERVVPRIERVVEPEAPAASFGAARDVGQTAEAAPTVAEVPILDEVVAEIPVRNAPVVAPPAPVDAAKPPRPRYRREIGRSLFRTFDSARHRCGGRSGTRIGGL